MATSGLAYSLHCLPTLSASDQLATLRNIKNHVAGHELRKREYISQGLVPCIGQLLQNLTSSHVEHHDVDSDAIWSQAADLVCVIAYGGPAFVHPILHGTLPSILMARLSSRTSLKTTQSILKCLNAIADNLPLSSTNDWIPDKRLADLLYTNSQMQVMAGFVSHTDQDMLSQQVCEETLALLCKTCDGDKHTTTLVSAGILSALGERLASFIVAEGLVIPGQEEYGTYLSNEEHLPQAAPTYAHLSPVLESIAMIIEASKLHTTSLLSDPAILAVLPSNKDQFSPSDVRKSPWGSNYFSGGAVPRSRAQTPLDMFLPYVPDIESRDRKEKSSFPPLGTASPMPKRRSSSIRATIEVPTAESLDEGIVEDGDESLLVPWLLYIVRTHRGKRRLLASRLLVILNSHNLVGASRSRSFGPLLAPVLIQMLDDALEDEDNSHLLLTGMSYVRLVPRVLSRLIEDDMNMQTIAFKADAIPKLAAGLKRSFDDINDREPVLWRPQKSLPLLKVVDSEDCTLGVGGPSLEARHVMLCREGLLAALAAIAPNDDDYRKEICEQGALVQIMLALEPFKSETKKQHEDELILVSSGNSTTTLLAACNAVRALTRSVTALRTRLVDANVGKAIVRLMHNTDPEVRIAATKVVANLVATMSPMKQTLGESTLIKKLCEQVHSANARLRLESIWALKSLVVESDNVLKREVIDELGANWIRHLIATDPHDIPPGEVIGLVEREYPPRSSRYLDHTSADVVMSDDSDDDEPPADQARATEELGSEYNKHTIEDDLAIQEQLIDLVRNLFCGAKASDIVEYLMGEIGHDEFMRILSNRLRAKTISGATRKNNQISTSPRGIVLSVLFVIVHIAASAPKFRNTIAYNNGLLRQIVSFCSHADAEIRVQCCWIVINLTYSDETSDREACRHRSEELHKAGFLPHMRRLELHDPSADVKERAKTASHLLVKQLP